MTYVKINQLPAVHLNVITQEVARALTEAGYMSLPEYIRLCKENKWVK